MSFIDKFVDNKNENLYHGLNRKTITDEDEAMGNLSGYFLSYDSLVQSSVHLKAIKPCFPFIFQIANCLEFFTILLSEENG